MWHWTWSRACPCRVTSVGQTRATKDIFPLNSNNPMLQMGLWGIILTPMCPKAGRLGTDGE